MESKYGEWNQYECECGELYMSYANLNTGKCDDCTDYESESDGNFYDADGNSY